MKYLIGLFFLFGSWMEIHAQLVTPVFRNYTTADGLPSNTITSLYEDSDGYLLIASTKGLVKYDGNEFQQLTEYWKVMYDLFESPHGEIWFNGGPIFSYFRDGNMVQFPLAKKVRQHAQGSLIQTPFFDSQGSVWFSIGNLDIAKDPYNRLKTVFQMTEDSLYSHDLSQDPDAHRLGICYWKLIEGRPIYTGRYRRQPIFPEQKKIQGPFPFEPDTFKRYINKMIRLKDGSYLASASNDLIHFDDSLVHFYGEHFLPRNSQIVDLYEDRNGSIWISTYNGVFRVDNQQFHEIDSYQHYFEGQLITKSIQTRDGSYWFSTGDDGLYQLPSLDTRWLRWPEDEKKTNIHKFFIWRDSMWLFANDGYFYVADTTYRTTKLPIPYHSTAPVSFILIKDQLLTSTRWLSTLNEAKYLPQFIGEGYEKNDKISFSLIRATGTDTVWAVNNAGGIVAINMAERRIVYNSRDQGFKKKINNVAIGPDGAVGILAYFDLWLFEDSVFFQPFDRYKGLETIDKTWDFTCIKLLKENKILLHSPDSGAVILLPDTMQVLRAGEIFHNFRGSCFSLEGDSAFWINSQRSFIRFAWNPHTHLFEQSGFFNPGFSLPHDAEFVNAFFHRGRIWVKTNKGVVSFKPQNALKKQTHYPPVHITHLEANGVLYSSDSTIQLRHFENRVILSYGIIAYNNHDRIQSRYRLIGTDEPWQYTTDPRIRYTNLDPGEYVFEIESSNGQGKFRNQPQRLAFEIKPHFSQTIWFRFAVTAFVFLLLYGAFRYATQHNNLRRLISELRYQALISQMNPHFIFNALNSISYLVRNQENDRANLYLGQFGGLLRGVLEHAEQPFVTLAEEVDQIQQYAPLEELQFNGDLEVDVEVDPDLLGYDLYLPPMLLQPCVENAVKHGIAPRGEGEILIHLMDVDDRILIAIRDDGIGREAAKAIRKKYISKKRRSIGVDNIRERIHTLNRLYKLDIQMWTNDLYERERPTGTQVEFSFPKLFHIPQISLRRGQF
ncbi:MAG: histidine kinase [Bacteroidota bacterium]